MREVPLAEHGREAKCRCQQSGLSPDTVVRSTRAERWTRRRHGPMAERSQQSIRHNQPCRASSTGRAAASKAGRRKPASVRIGPSSPCLVSSVEQSGRLLPGGSAVRIGHEAPVHFPDSADGRAPGRQSGPPWFEAMSEPSQIDLAGLGGSAASSNRRSRWIVRIRGYQVQLGVAQLAARVIWDHEAAGSRPATETRQACATAVAVAPWQSRGL